MSNWWSRAATIIKRHEGYRDQPYRCTAGALTIGWGHNMDAHPLPAPVLLNLDTLGRITTADAELLLDQGMLRAEHDCRRIFPGFETFSDNRKAALVDWLFNLGRPRALKFVRTIHLINTGRWEEAAEAMRQSKWYRQLGGDPAGTNDGRIERPETITDMIEGG